MRVDNNPNLILNQNKGILHQKTANSSDKTEDNNLTGEVLNFNETVEKVSDILKKNQGNSLLLSATAGFLSGVAKGLSDKVKQEDKEVKLSHGDEKYLSFLATKEIYDKPMAYESAEKKANYIKNALLIAPGIAVNALLMGLTKQLVPVLLASPMIFLFTFGITNATEIPDSIGNTIMRKSLASHRLGAVEALKRLRKGEPIYIRVDDSKYEKLSSIKDLEVFILT